MEMKRRHTGDSYKCAAAGLLAGLANGFFGAGGGVFVVPLFTRWVKLEQRAAYASSVAVILPLCVVSAVTYALRGGVEFIEAAPYLIGGVAGGLIGGGIFHKVPPKLLRRAFALLLIIGGAKGLLM